jgi:hypothetical protein
LQAQESNDIPPPPAGFGITVSPTTDARIVAEFYLQLIKDRLPEDVAKDLTIAYILKQNPFGQ